MEQTRTMMQQDIAAMMTAKANGDLNAFDEAESALKKHEKEYAKLAKEAEYDLLKGQPDPFVAAIKQRTYKVLRHITNTNEDGQIVGYELVEKERQFDLLDLCVSLGIDTDWQYLLETVNCQFTIRTAKELGLPKSEVDKIPTSYAMQRKAREIAKNGGDITSNAKCKSALQELIDAMPTPVDEEGNPVYKVNSYDVNYVINCYCKKGKSALAVASAKKGFFLGLIEDVLYRIATDGKYSVEYKAVKSK